MPDPTSEDAGPEASPAGAAKVPDADPASANGTAPARGPDPLVLHALLGNLSRRIVDDATGAQIPYGTRLERDPHGRLWLGMLASEPQLIADTLRGNTYSSKLVPAAQGFSFKVPALPVDLTLRVEASAFVPLHPTVDEQRNSVTDSREGDDTAGAASGPGSAAGGASNQGHKLAAVWTKVTIDPVTVHVTVTPASPRRARIAEAELSNALRAAARPPAGASPFRPRRQTSPVGILPRDDDMIDHVTWDAYTAKNLVALDDLVPPEFRAAVDLEVTTTTDGVEIVASVVNTSPTAETQLFDGTHPYDSSAIESRLYEVRLTADAATPLVPYQLEQVAKSFRYDRTVLAFGQGAPVAVTTGPATLTTLRTEFAATQQTPRMHARTALTLPGTEPVGIDTTFASLIAEPIATVEALLEAHNAWVEHHWSDSELDRLATELSWDPSARDEANVGAADACDEVAWVRAGLDLLRTHEDVREAFVLANQTMAMVAAGSYDAWRPFQVAWILGCLPGMVDPGAHPEVNIVWFATGGGKSEAYLGLMAATLFYARLTGTRAGTQVWARFPLRLLALQQLERFAAVVCNAELLRAAHPIASVGDQFGLGFFVGSGNTPNSLEAPDSRFYRGTDPNAPETAELCRVLESCPRCGTRVEVRFDPHSWTMQHHCVNGSCQLAGVLPVWSVDSDIYRHAPSVLVGTVDKLAQLGQSSRFRVLLGGAASRCPVHGYTADPRYCAVFGCTASRQTIPAGALSGIRLEIADELHLLEESLGALDGMYETLLQSISAALGNPSIQVVGATATIEGYKTQVGHLYQRDARRFPVNGPTVTDTFWSTTHLDDPLRDYLGVRPRGITMVTATREIALTHAAWLAELHDDPAAMLTCSGVNSASPAALATAEAAWSDLYEVLVAYCLRNEDLNSFTRDPAIQELLETAANLAIINGDAEPAHIRDAVRRLTNPPADPDQRVKMIAATRAIGHGFDVGRLGFMTIMGTPTQAAEIIQASARVGRRWPGLVVNVINPSRDRDASVYRYYADWIRFLDRLVHKVPVNRESLPVLRRVMSGGLMAWLLNVHDAAWLAGGTRRVTLRKSTGFADAVNAGFIDKAILVANLTAGFGVPSTSVYHQMHRDAVTAWVDQQLATLPLRAEAGKQLRELLNPTVPTSLRDVEESITIYGTM